MFGFEKLEVWQRTRQFIKKIYDITKGFPKEEQFNLTQHIRRSAISILSNIAEGTSRFTKEDFRRFIQLSVGSLYETVAQLFVALDNDYLKEKVFRELYEDAEVIVKMLSRIVSSKKSSL